MTRLRGLAAVAALTLLAVALPRPATAGDEPAPEEPPTEASETPTEASEPPTEASEPPTEASEPPTEASETPTEAAETPAASAPLPPWMADLREVETATIGTRTLRQGEPIEVYARMEVVASMKVEELRTDGGAGDTMDFEGTLDIVEFYRMTPIELRGMEIRKARFDYLEMVEREIEGPKQTVDVEAVHGKSYAVSAKGRGFKVRRLPRGSAKKEERSRVEDDLTTLAEFVEGSGGFGGIELRSADGRVDMRSGSGARMFESGGAFAGDLPFSDTYWTFLGLRTVEGKEVAVMKMEMVLDGGEEVMGLRVPMEGYALIETATGWLHTLELAGPIDVEELMEEDGVQARTTLKGSMRFEIRER